jgi:hypothetical protein
MDFSPQWHALGSEAELAASQIAHGVTALGRAGQSRHGEYPAAFFGLSIGLERLGKLVVIADYRIERGRFPRNDFLHKKFSHDLVRILDHCESASCARGAVSGRLRRPNDVVHQRIVETLSEFAKQTRYYNLDLIARGKAANMPEPVGSWWSRVGGPILARHYTTRQMEKDNAIAESLNELLSPYMLIRQHTEASEPTSDLATVMRHSGATRVIQKYGRLYVLQIVRWLSYTISSLVHEAGKNEIEPLFGLDEPFKAFWGDDHYFRRRKRWAIYR